MPISTVNQKGLDAPLTLTSPVLTTPNLGTPSALVLTNATGTPAAINLSNATALPKAALPAGCILQVVQGTSLTVDSTTNGGFVATSLSLSITPTSASSKILLFSTATVGMSTANIAKVAFARNGSLINNGAQNWGASYYISSSSFSNSGYPWAETYLDSPATTSATTYAVYFGVDTGGPIRFNSRGGNDNGGLAVIIAMEIAA